MPTSGPFATISRQLEDVQHVLGPIPDDPEDSVQGQLRTIREAVSGGLTRLDPRYVWAAPTTYDTWLIDGERSHMIRLFVTAHNGSLDAAKVRLQGLFGGVVVIERDVEVPSGQSRVLLSDPTNRPADTFLDRQRGLGPLPDTYVLSSNVKVLVEGVIERTKVDLNDSGVFVPGGGFAHAIPFQLLDCSDASYLRTCAAPVVKTSWDVFVEW